MMNSVAPLSPYKPTAEELARLSRLAEVLRIASAISTLTGATFLLLAAAYGVPRYETLGVTWFDDWIRDLAAAMPPTYAPQIAEVVPARYQFALLKAFGVVTLCSLVVELVIYQWVSEIRNPRWRRMIDS